MSSPKLKCTHRTSNYNFNSNTNATLKHVDSSDTNITTTTNTNTNTTSPSLVYHITNNNCQTVNINGLTESGINLDREDDVHRGHSQADATPDVTDAQRQNHRDEAPVAEPAPATVGMISYPAFLTTLAIGASWIHQAFLGISGIMNRPAAVEGVVNAQITGEVADEDEA
ncbi:hypothetical protein PM082_023993 [Marasmius tenuissimus]|nr:hypothetical protein PM082_023993 [Marasmius tenuissimus]